MRLVVCAVYDAAVQAFLPPFYVRARGEGIRTFIQNVGMKDSPFGQHPKDFTLFQVADFDDHIGVFAVPDGNAGAPVALMTAVDALATTRDAALV